jgi:hypothetical protein
MVDVVVSSQPTELHVRLVVVDAPIDDDDSFGQYLPDEDLVLIAANHPMILALFDSADDLIEMEQTPDDNRHSQLIQFAALVVGSQLSKSGDQLYQSFRFVSGGANRTMKLYIPGE